MRIEEVAVEKETAEKIFKKHGVMLEEIKRCFLEQKTLYFKTRQNNYLALSHNGRSITIVFGYSNGTAEIITAYESSKWQKKLYKRKRK